LRLASGIRIWQAWAACAAALTLFGSSHVVLRNLFLLTACLGLLELLRRPDVDYAALMTLPGAGAAIGDVQAAEQVEIQAKSLGYIARQQEEVARHQYYEAMVLPLGLDYCEVHGLSIEVQQKLNQHKPETLGQAGRISGVTPAAISVLLWMQRGTAR